MFFLNHLKSIMPQITQNLYVITTKNGIFLLNINTIIKSRKFTLIYYYHLIHELHSSFLSVPVHLSQQNTPSGITCFIQLSHLSFSFSIEQFFSLFLTFLALAILNSTGWLFYIVSQILVFIVCPHVQIQVIYFCRECQRNNALLIASCQVVNYINSSHY